MSTSDPKQAGEKELEEKRALLKRMMAERGSRNNALPALTRLTQGSTAPLSFSQEAIWFLQALEPTSSAYNESVLGQLRGPLQVPALEQALSEFVRRHAILRTTFEQQGSELVQVIHEPAPVRLEVVDLSGLGAAEQERRRQEIVLREIDRPFDLRHGPLVRFTLMRMSASEHSLFNVFHHIVTDGNSLRIFAQEVMALYDAFHVGRPAALPEPPFQYTDFALWQRAHLTGPSWEQHLDYWRRKLASPEPLRLPTDRPRPRVLSTRGSSFKRPMPAELMAALSKLASAERVTLFMLLQAAFQVLLSRYSGQTDISVGVSYAGRTRDTEKVFGCFINTIVLRTDLSGDPSFRELVTRVRQTNLEAYSHAVIPFHQVVAAIKPERDPSRVPLFDVLFDVGPEGGILQGEQLFLSRETVLPSMPKCDIAFAFVEDAQGAYKASFNYSEDLFDHATIERMAEHLEVLLQGIVAAPQLRLSQLSLLGPAERERLVVRFNDTRLEQSPRRLHELFEAQVEQRPDALALEFQGQRLTYRALNERANRIAHYLRKRGVGPEVVVAVCVERGLELIVAALAVLKAGGAYAPIDPTLPAGRISLILEDTWAPVLLTQRDLQDQLERTAAFTFCMEDEEELDGESGSNPPRVGSPGDLAYVIYTSGSTGQPKGTLIEHASAFNAIAESVRSLAVGEGSRVLQFASAGFDASIKEIFTALCAGAALVLGSKDELMPGPALSRLVRERRITHVMITPQVLATLSPRELPDLQGIVVGGEACPAELMDRWAEGRRFVNEYGPTEATITATSALCTPGMGRPPLGRCLPNTRAYVLDEALRPVPMNIPGELFIGGVGVGRGYLNRPDLTAERFVPDPFSSEPGARLYRTGDRVRHRSDGQLEFIGRVDEQVKLRGFRIEPGEIAATLRRQASVKEAAVLVREDTPGLPQLVAYVTPRSTVPPDAQELRESLRQELPDYMVPAAFVVLAALPLTPSGKLDRKALPAPNPESAGAEAEKKDEPRGAVEQKIAALWKALLGLERVGREDDFFELGGHSLLAGQLADQIREELFLELPVRALFEHSTLTGLAEHLQHLLESGEHLALPPLERGGPGAVRPLSYAQEQLWKLVARYPANSTYNVVDSFRVTAPLEAEPLRRAWDEVHRRHDVLRTTFTRGDAGPVQQVAPAGPAPLEVHDLSHLAGGEQAREILRHIEQASRRPFALGEGPPVRAEWIRCGPTEHVLLFVIHELVTDAASMDVLLEELLVLHEAFRAGKRSPLSEPPIQYADYARWQRQWLTGPLLERELEYWRARLSPPPAPLRLPHEKPSPELPSERTEMTERILFSPELATALRGVCQREGATPFMLLTAAFHALLGRLTEQEDIVVGTPVLGRNRSELQRAVGLFINVVALRVRASQATPFRQLLATVRGVMLEAFEHQELPIELLAEALGAQRHPTQAPFFQALVSMHTTPALTSPSGARIERLPGKSGAFRCALTLRGFDDTDGMGIQFEYDTDVLDAVTAGRMQEALGSFLQQVARNPGAPVSELWQAGG